MSAHALVGRQREQQVLLLGLAALADGRGGLYLLSGEPGIGKTRLADEVARQAEAQGLAVAWGAAWDGGAAPAYWPWIEVVRSLRPLLPEPDRQLRRDLGPLWSEGSATDSAQTDPAATQDPELLGFRRFDALRALVQQAAGRRPLLLILEDLHAADRASLQALLLIARGVRRLPVMLLGTHRPAEAAVDVEIERLLGRLAREGTSLQLGRLTRAEVASLLDDLDPLPPRLLDEVYQASGGNPLFVGESLRVVRTGGRLEQAAEGLSALIRERLARFDAPAREALELAAVLGREMQRAVLAEACGVSVEQLEARLRAPRQAGLIQDAPDGPDGDQLQFVHGLYREGLIDDLPAERRPKLHLRVAQALLRRRAAGHLEAEEPLARHLLVAGAEGDPRLAVEWAVRAGRSALAGLAFDRAVGLFEGALEACEVLAAGAAEPGAAEAAAQRMDIELELAEALVRVGAGARSRALCLAAADQARVRGDAVRLARAALAYGAELRLAVVDATLVSLLREALAALGEGEPRLRARVQARLAAAQQPAPDPQLPVAEARAAIALAQSTGDAETLLATLHSAGLALVDFAPAEERLPLDRQMVALALPRGELTIGQQGYARLAIDGFELGDLDEVELAIAGHERLGRALGHPRWRWRTPLLRSMRALLAGDWQQSEQAVAEAAALIAETDDASALGTLLIHQAGALRAREAADARQVPTFLEPALTGVQYIAELAPLTRASMFARLGDLAGARRCLEALPADLRRFAADPLAIALLTDAVVSVGDRGRAAQLVPMVEAYRGRCLSWGVYGLIWEGPVTHLEGALQVVLGQWAAAVPALEQALAMAEAVGARPLAARAAREVAWALWHRGEAGDRERARQHLARAAALAAELGMVHLQAAIARTGATLGTGETAPTRSEPPPAAPVSVPIQLAREGQHGDIWLVTWGGRQSRLKHARGLEILEQLMREPGREFHVLALGGGDAGEVIDLGDAGEVLDEDARTAYRQRLRELEQELEEAQAWADAGRRDRLQAEIEFLSEELGRAVGLGGRVRRSGAAVERARSNVQKRIRAVIRKLDETWPELASHLDTHVRTGTYVSYRP